MEKNFLLGLDVGGTKCACILGAAVSGGGIEILDKVKFPTAEAGTPRQCLERMAELGLELCSRARRRARTAARLRRLLAAARSTAAAV